MLKAESDRAGGSGGRDEPTEKATIQDSIGGAQRTTNCRTRLRVITEKSDELLIPSDVPGGYQLGVNNGQIPDRATRPNHPVSSGTTTRAPWVHNTIWQQLHNQERLAEVNKFRQEKGLYLWGNIVEPSRSGQLGRDHP